MPFLASPLAATDWGKKWPGSYCQTGPLSTRHVAHSMHRTYRPVSGLLIIPIHLTLQRNYIIYVLKKITLGWPTRDYPGIPDGQSGPAHMHTHTANKQTYIHKYIQKYTTPTCAYTHTLKYTPALHSNFLLPVWLPVRRTCLQLPTKCCPLVT